MGFNLAFKGLNDVGTWNQTRLIAKLDVNDKRGLAVILFEIVKVYTFSIILAHNLTTLTMR